MALISDWEQRVIGKGLAQGMAQGVAVGKEQKLALGKEDGLAQGVAVGKHKLIARQIRHRFYPNAVPDAVVTAMSRLSTDQLDDLGEALLDFAGPGDLDAWLSAR